MGWPLFWRAPAAPSASDAARVLSERAARAREAAAIPIAERRARITAELHRSRAVSPLPSRDEVVAPIRAARANRKEQKYGQAI